MILVLYIIGGGVVGLIILFWFLGHLSSQEKKNTPKNLQKASSKFQSEDFTDLLEDHEVAHINTVGQFIMKRQIAEAIDYLNEQLEVPGISNHLYATLLEQRAGCFFMQKKYDLSRGDYESVLRYFPYNKRVLESLKDVKRKC